MHSFHQFSETGKQGISEIVLHVLNAEFNTNHATTEPFLDELRRGKRVPFKQYRDSMVQLEQVLAKELQKNGKLEGVYGIEFPVNVRIAHAVPPKDYLKLVDATDYLHCDPWAGEPTDSINVFSYLHTEEGCPQLQLFESIRANPAAVAYNGGYRDAPIEKEKLEEIDVPLRTDFLLVFDSFSPHRTFRKGNGVRMSVDFRLKAGDPYADISESWMRDRIPLGKYWYLPAQGASTFDERVSTELNTLAETFGTESRELKARKDYIEKFFELA
ncbi:hypothetical protein FIV00_27925 [Labrenzia sp. THAF82]|uniref:hypothetical protein n=1 Tax=Labrenzia sp. THAF82 TaxID=2587861 RepID=UPI0012691357|nr:hypothetical protein [Labrenzia sp. THAF82]QFT34355.1 hypothetical protein FIV00_27925 [Labrenzia sp. THAF82]